MATRLESRKWATPQRPPSYRAGMTRRWGSEGPPLDAYSRVTDPHRYAALGDVADELVADLVRRYDVEVDDEPVDGPRDTSAVRLRPRSVDSADLVVVRTDFGVRLRAGRWAEESFPSCGCDACDEDVVDVSDELREYVADVVGGRLEEELRRGLTGGELAMRRPLRSSSTSLSRAQVRELGPPGRSAWAAWPKRAGG
jgi:hypothetical protein